MKIAIVLTGYYYKYLKLYKLINEETKLYKNIEFELFISSHKKKQEIPQSTLEYLEENKWRILYFPNEGWDWGCHSQFIKWFFKSNIDTTDYFLFLHDDIKIIKNGFIEAFLRKAEEGYQVIGNSSPFSVIRNYSFEFPEESYILKKNGFPTPVRKINPIRGSALFVSSYVAKIALENLPFQRFGEIDLANRSLRMFAAITKGYDLNTAYLSADHLKSNYIVEEMRGNEQTSLFFFKRKYLSARKIIKRIGEEILIITRILKRGKQKNKRGTIKLHISAKTPLPKYLNYDVTDKSFSDIHHFDKEIEHLIVHQKISEIRVAENVGSARIDILNRLKNIITVSSRSSKVIEIFIEGDFNHRTWTGFDSTIEVYKDYSLRFGQARPKRRLLLKIHTK